VMLRAALVKDARHAAVPMEAEAKATVPATTEAAGETKSSRAETTPCRTDCMPTRRAATQASPTSAPANNPGSRAAAAHLCPIAGRACVGACAPETTLPPDYLKARKHLGAHLCALRNQHDSSGGGQVPADLVSAVHAVAFDPARSRFCEPCCMLRSPTPVPRALMAAIEPPSNWPLLTPCGRHAGGPPARCAPPPTLAAAAPAALATAPAPAPPAQQGVQRIPRPSIREVLGNELRAPELWTDLLAQLRKNVARLLRSF
jgi:hypothetical protein